MKKYLTAIALISAMTMIITGCSRESAALQKSGRQEPSVQPSENPAGRSGSGQQFPDAGRPDGQPSRKQKKDESGVDKPLLKETVKVTAGGEPVVTNPASILVCANKNRNLPADYVPESLVIPDIRFIYGKNAEYPKMQMRKIAAGPIKRLFQAANEEGIHLFAVSGYRSYHYQVTVFARNVDQYGSKKKANQVSAKPGQSEHQTGLSMDVTAAGVDYQLTQEFGKTKAGKWVAANAWKYGFIIRYPKGKEGITGYSYEPWHIRYVGKQAAKVIAEKDITLEKYLSE